MRCPQCVLYDRQMLVLLEGRKPDADISKWRHCNYQLCTSASEALFWCCKCRSHCQWYRQTVSASKCLSCKPDPHQAFEPCGKPARSP